VTNDERLEAQQKAIAAGLGVPWEAYSARMAAGVKTWQPYAEWSPRWYLRFAWRPEDKPFARTWDEGNDDEAIAADLAHNRAILAAIPKTEPVPPDDVLSLAVTRWGRPGMSYKFESPLVIRMGAGMRGYTPVFDDDGKPVLIDGYLMMCEKPAAMIEVRTPEADEKETDEEPPQWSTRGRRGNGDVFRVTWGALGRRGVFALYRFTRHSSNSYVPLGDGTLRLVRGKTLRGIELMTQRRGRDPRSRRLGFYRRLE